MINAKETLLQNDGLAQKFAYEFCIEQKKSCSTFQYDDCLQCARIGLFRAIQRYNKTYGKLSTYAWYYMNAECMREYKKCKSVIHTPVNTHLKYNTFLNLEDEVEPFYSLESDEYISIEDTIIDGNKLHDPFIAAFEEFIISILKKCILHLPCRNAYVLIKRYGLDSGEGRTLDDIGRMFGVQGERIRQIEAKSLRIIRRKIYEVRLSIKDVEDCFSIGNLTSPMFEDVKEMSYHQFMERYY